MVIVVRPVFEDKGNFHPQVYLDECLYELQMLEYDCYAQIWNNCANL